MTIFISKENELKAKESVAETYMETYMDIDRKTVYNTAYGQAKILNYHGSLTVLETDNYYYVVEGFSTSTSHKTGNMATWKSCQPFSWYYEAMEYAHWYYR